MLTKEKRQVDPYSPPLTKGKVAPPPLPVRVLDSVNNCKAFKSFGTIRCVYTQRGVLCKSSILHAARQNGLPWCGSPTKAPYGMEWEKVRALHDCPKCKRVLHKSAVEAAVLVEKLGGAA